MVKNLTDKGLSKQHKVKVMTHSGCTSEDMVDFIKPVIRRKPDVVLLHAGTNDLTGDVNTLKKLKKVVNEIKESNNEMKIIISGIIHRKDKNLKENIENINKKLKSFCEERDIIYMDNENIDPSCLNKGGLHLNRKGNSIFANNILNILKVQ